jgi:hypothetical protein
LILGGSSWDTGIMDSVELFNVQTQESCSFGTLPAPTRSAVGGIFNGLPVYCGGQTNNVFAETSCYKYQNSWNPVNIFLCIFSSSSQMCIHI